MRGRRHGEYNQAGDLSPHSDAYGRAFQEHAGTFVHRGEVWGSQDTFGYGGFIGSFLAVGSVRDVYVGDSGYYGDLPADLQPSIDAPPPWERSP